MELAAGTTVNPLNCLSTEVFIVYAHCLGG